MRTLLETWHPDLFVLNASNPNERWRLVEGYERIDTQLRRAQHLVENDSHMQGHRHSDKLIATRDRLDAILTELHMKVYGIDVAANIEECRSRDCRQAALPPIEGSGYCPTCLVHAQNGTQPTFDQAQSAKAIVGSPWGRENY
jgi:hypothetical protein